LQFSGFRAKVKFSIERARIAYLLTLGYPVHARGEKKSMNFKNRRLRHTAAALTGIVATTVMLCAGVLPASAASTPVTEITIGSSLTQVCQLQPAPDGSLWFVESQTRRLGRLDLKTGVIQKFDLPPVTVTPVLPAGIQLPGAVPIGPCDATIPGDGNLWFTDQYNNAVGYISLTPPYAMKEIALPTPDSVPMSLATGANGDIYVTQTGSNQIAEVNVSTHAVTEYNVPTPLSGIIGGIAGQDGAQWFDELTAGKLLRFDYATKQMTEYPIPTPGALPFIIRSYSGQIWFTESGADAIGHYDPTTGTFTSVTLPTPASVPIGLTQGVDGNLYTDESVGNKFAEIDPATSTVVGEYAIPTAASVPIEIKTGPDGAIWSPEFAAGKIARLWLPQFGTDPGVPQDGGSVTGATTYAQDSQRLLGLGP
jgi:virginiamycin B lyase